MPRNLRETAKFKSDKQRVKKSGRHDWQKMLTIVGALINDQTLPARNRDHKLTGNYAGVRECHIEPDWLLIYDKEGSVDAGELILVRTGSHSELF
jgi:mRNA interferase YafQ